MEGSRKGRLQRARGLMAGDCTGDTMFMSDRLLPNPERTILLSHTFACMAIRSRLYRAVLAKLIVRGLLGAIWEQAKDGPELVSATEATTWI
jgi:hypothetical protein